MKSRENLIVQVIANTVLGLFALCAILPFVLLIISSFTDNNWAMGHGFSFFPKEWSVDAYLYIANKWETIGRAYAMTIIVTVSGTALSIIVTTLFAYGLSKDNLPGSRFITFLVIFTMLFNGGLVATYYTYVNVFHIKNTIWALILPGLVMNAFNVILVKNYFIFSIPASLTEAARIDGASEFKIFLKIILPLSLPITATIGLMTAIMYWNDWQNGLYYLTAKDGSKLYTIQLVLNSMNENIKFLSGKNSASLVTGVTNLPSVTIRMAIAVIGILPILMAYPFFQKYFVKGITLGGVKE